MALIVSADISVEDVDHRTRKRKGTAVEEHRIVLAGPDLSVTLSGTREALRGFLLDEKLTLKIASAQTKISEDEEGGKD